MKCYVIFYHKTGNAEFDPSHIVNWKTTGRGDVLKDYYFQTSKPIKIFKDQFLEI